MSDETPTAIEARSMLTPRDLQVIDLVSHGRERNAIAEELQLSRTAVDRILSKALRLTGTRNSAHLVGRILRQGTGPDPLRTRASELILGALVRDPIDDVDLHVNDVIRDIARHVRRNL